MYYAIFEIGHYRLFGFIPTPFKQSRYVGSTTTESGAFELVEALGIYNFSIRQISAAEKVALTISLLGG